MELGKTCSNCRELLKGKYCHRCGQQVVATEGKIETLIWDFIHFFSHLDKKFFKTVYTLFCWPGEVTKAFDSGITVRYVKLTTVFLVATLVYLLLPNRFVISNNMITSYQIDVHGSGIGNWKRDVAARKMARLDIPKERFVAEYNARKKIFGKMFTVLFIPLTFPLLWSIYSLARKVNKYEGRKRAYELCLAALEINSVILIGFYVVTGLFCHLLYLIHHSETLFIGMVIGCVCLLIFTFQRFFRTLLLLNVWQGLVCALSFTVGYVIVLSIYGLISFLILI